MTHVTTNGDAFICRGTLTKLRQLYIFLGSTTNLAALPGFPALEGLSLMRITKLSDAA